METLKSIGLRLLNAVILIVAVIVLNFALIHFAPGDPAEVIAGEMGGATEEMLASIRAAYGLDQPATTQLYIYMVRALRGDLGVSVFYNVPVTDLIMQPVVANITASIHSTPFWL